MRQLCDVFEKKMTECFNFGSIKCGCMNNVVERSIKGYVQGGRGGYSIFQVTGMIEWRQKSKPPKIPGPKFNPKKSHAEFPSHKNFQKALNDIKRIIKTFVMECLCLFIHTQQRYAGTITNLHIIVLNSQKNPYLNQATPKNTCQNFPTQKYPKIEILKPKQILRSSLSLEIQSTPTGVHPHCAGMKTILGSI